MCQMTFWLRWICGVTNESWTLAFKENLSYYW